MQNRHLIKNNSLFSDAVIPAKAGIQSRGEHPLFNILRPFVKLVSSMSVMNKLEGFAYEKYLKRLTLCAGMDEVISAKDAVAYQVVMMVMFACFGLVFCGGGFVVIVASAIAGAFYPVIWLSSLAKERRKEISLRLPYFLDLLTLSVEAGLDLISAIKRIVENSEKSVLTDEFGKMLGMIKLGSSRREALQMLKERLMHPSVDSFVTMVTQADTLGTPIGPILKAHAEKLRTDRFQNAERAGVSASQQILIPLVFCIMPAVFIVVFGPIFIMWRNGAFAKLF